MPPKPKFTREEIIDAAAKLVREHGIGALKARELGNYLGSSARPIFTVFESMEQIAAEVRLAVMEQFEARVRDGLKKNLSFMEVGMQVIHLAMKEPHLYQLLFMSENEQGIKLKTLMERDDFSKRSLILLMDRYGLKQEEALELLHHLEIYTYGIATMCAKKICHFSEDEIMQMLKREFLAILKLIKSEQT